MEEKTSCGHGVCAGLAGVNRVKPTGSCSVPEEGRKATRCDAGNADGPGTAGNKHENGRGET